MADPLTIAAVGGLGISAFAKLEESSIAAENAEIQAKIREEESRQVDASVASQLEILEFEGKQIIGKQKLGFAEGGVELVGSPAAFLEGQLALLEKEQENIIKTGQFKKGALSTEALSLRESISDIERAGTIGALSGALLGGAQLGLALRGTPKKTPKNFGG